jgi:hypothetical protein
MDIPFMDDNKPDDNNHRDIRTRKFADVTLPLQRKKVSNRPPPLLQQLGPLRQLPGVWTGQGTGWNMIALPFQNAPLPNGGFKFRVLMNQYDEELLFTFVDDDVPNRGLLRPDEPVAEGSDQAVVTLDYQQKIAQVDGPALPLYKGAEDRPNSGGLAGGPKLPIHHEPGLWLFDKNRKAKDDQFSDNQVTQPQVKLDIARLASIPHGNSVLALGKSQRHIGMPEIPPLSGLPSGRFEDVFTPDYDFKSDPYLEPYKHYIDNPFMGNVTGVPGFPGFNPADMNQILRFANQSLIDAGSKIVRTTNNLDRRHDSEKWRDKECSFHGSRGRAGQHEVYVLDSRSRRQSWKEELTFAILASRHARLFPPPRR